MVKHGDLKYTCFGHDDSEILFDLDRDPGEERTVADDERYADDVRRFRTRRDELGYGPDPDPDYENAGYAT